MHVKIANVTTTHPSSLLSCKQALLTLLTLGTSLSFSSSAAPLTIVQQQAVNTHFSKLAQVQNTAEAQMTEQLQQDFNQQLTLHEHKLMKSICPKYGMTFDVSTNACLR
ncbi:hypothetical protein C9I43_13580 [Shewanella morhuae]|uniref:Uncharacterized protein n=1 Tax=Shewanella morhuae TaxID=365591 RepID=A0ABX5HX08_9GAMM|nr:hypothetical protein [Shewanella morhuae]PTA51445.1 hypothetical protein C9I43_13580 [Shewanella morhuae]